MKLIGIDLYQHLLESSIRAARGEDVEQWNPELHLGIEGRLTEDWLPDEELRVTLYCRLARIEDAEGLQAFADELEDRFGTVPADADTLLRIARIRIAASVARVLRIDAGPAAIALTPRADFSGKVDGLGLKRKKERWLLSERIEDPVTRLAQVEKLVEALSDH